MSCLKYIYFKDRDTDIVIKKLYLVYNYLSFKEIYSMTSTTMAAISGMSF